MIYSDNTIKVLFIEHSLPFYRVPTWEMIGSHPMINLTVAYGKGFFTGIKDGVPEGKIPENTNVNYASCRIVKNFFGKKYLWHTAALRMLKANRYDIVIHQAETKIISLLIAMKKAQRKKAKFALWGIGDPLIPSPILLEKYRKFLAKKADAFIFYSELNKQKYIRLGIDPEKLFVAKNSIDVSQIIEFTRQWNNKKIQTFKKKNGLSSFTVLTVGRLIPRKRIDWLIKAVKQIKLAGKEIKLVVIGEGPESQKYKALASNLKIQDDVIFTGKLVGIDLLGPWYICSDTIVAPAQVGHLATEAHAYGKPLILSDYRECQGPESQILVPGETGLLYKHSIVEDLVDKITILMDEEKLELKYKTKCQKRAQEFAGTKIMANGFLDTINKLTSNNLSLF